MSLKTIKWMLTFGIVFLVVGMPGVSMAQEAASADMFEGGLSARVIQLFFVVTVLSLAPCLLYTSPSPRDQRGSRMPSSA